jgi:hypothetical protein
LELRDRRTRSTAPITATMPSDRPMGTAHPAQVIGGDSAAFAAGEMLR